MILSSSFPCNDMMMEIIERLIVIVKSLFFGQKQRRVTLSLGCDGLVSKRKVLLCLDRNPKEDLFVSKSGPKGLENRNHDANVPTVSLLAKSPNCQTQLNPLASWTTRNEPRYCFISNGSSMVPYHRLSESHLCRNKMLLAGAVSID